MTAADAREMLIADIAQRFRCFGTGSLMPEGNPIAFALKDKPPSFAAGVDVGEVVDFILSAFPQIAPPSGNEGAGEPEALARVLCAANGVPPDAVNAEGDFSVPGGSRSWPMWAEWDDIARAVLAAGYRLSLAPGKDALTKPSAEKVLVDLLVASAPYADADETGRLPEARMAAEQLLAEMDMDTVKPPPEENALSDLVHKFRDALLAKLRRAEEKYGYKNAWQKAGWASELREKLLRHVDKGDPLDVAAYCAFAWHHGWSLAAPQVAPGKDVAEGAQRIALRKWCGRFIGFAESKELEDDIARFASEREARVREECAEIADQYASVNLEMAGDTILADPVLHGKRDAASFEKSDALMVEGAMGSASYHTANYIAKAIRAGGSK